ncbi:MAG: proline dehydrogenase family protein [Acidobacteriota bacterium]
MIAGVSKAVFSTLATSGVLKRLASRYGMRRPQSFARRFVAGETLAEAMAAAESLERQGLTVTIDHLGESLTASETALAATREYIDTIRVAAAAGISRNLSVKLTQIGLDVDRATATDHLRRILEAAVESDFFVRIDMEGSAYTAHTLDIFENLWGIGYRNVGVVIQSCLRRSADDVRRLNELGARVRLVKGAYREPKDVAFQVKEEVDARFVELMRVLVSQGVYPALATHDPAMIAATQQHATSQGIDKSRFEFQMLFGIRRDLQASLAAEGHPVRVYLPFGREWFPYFMRRLGERPANVGFVLKSLLREEAQP